MGEPEATDLAPYLCPGDCGTWVRTPAYSCLDCWCRENPLPPHVARRLHRNPDRSPL